MTETAGTASNQEVHTPHIYAFLFYLVLQCSGSEAPIFLTAFIVAAFCGDGCYYLCFFPLCSQRTAQRSWSSQRNVLATSRCTLLCHVLVPPVTAQLSCPGINPNIQNYILSIERVVMTQLSHILKYCRDEDT